MSQDVAANGPTIAWVRSSFRSNVRPAHGVSTTRSRVAAPAARVESLGLVSSGSATRRSRQPTTGDAPAPVPYDTSGTLPGMAQKQPRRDDGPSLELPSFGLRRRRKRSSVEESEAPAQPQEQDPRSESHDAPPPPPDEGRTPARPEPEAAPAREAAPEPEQPSEPKRRRRTAPVAGLTAAMVTGGIVGLGTVGLTWGSMRLCEVVRGTSSCGNPGFLVLLAILVLMALLGKALLRASGVRDPGSTSLLGIGLVAVLALLFLVEQLLHWWMAIVIPVAAVATFALSYWVTTTFVEPASIDDMHR